MRSPVPTRKENMLTVSICQFFNSFTLQLSWIHRILNYEGNPSLQILLRIRGNKQIPQDRSSDHAPFAYGVNDTCFLQSLLNNHWLVTAFDISLDISKK